MFQKQKMLNICWFFSYWRKFIENNSSYIFAGGQKDSTADYNPAGITTSAFLTNKDKTISGSGFDWATDSTWDQDAQDAKFAVSGNKVYTLSNGKNYDGQTDISNSSALSVDLAGLVAGYEILKIPKSMILISYSWDVHHMPKKQHRHLLIR